MFTVISYDVVDDRRRTKLAKVLKNYGHRVQYSVFEGNLEKKHLDALMREASACIDPDEDQVRFYQLCGECKKRVDTVGRKAWVESEEEDKECIVV